MIVVAAIAGCAGMATPLSGATRSWVGGNSTWDNATAWDPAGQPQEGDQVLIGQNGATVTYANPLDPRAIYPDLGIDAPGTNGATLSQAQSTLNLNQFVIGGSGTGAMVHSGGAVNVLTGNVGLSVGSGPTGSGAYTLGASAILTVTGQVTVGELGTGTFTQTGGRMIVTPLGGFPGVLSIGANTGSTGVYNLSGGTVESGSVQLSPFGGDATFNHSAGAVVLPADLSLGDPTLPGLTGKALYNHTGGAVSVQQLNIGSTGTFKQAGGTLRTNQLTIDLAGGRVDLTNQSMVVEYSGTTSAMATIRTYLKGGYNGGAWDGSGIGSSVAGASGAVGAAEASELLGISGTNTAQWNGQTVDGTSVLLQYTLGGDATLDGAVDFNDLVKLAQNYNTIGQMRWTTGDFNYDNNVDFADLVLLAQNYNTALPPAGAVPGAGAAFEADLARVVAGVPEPSTFSGAGVLALFAWRRRRHG
jgi:hypothetical protein